MIAEGSLGEKSLSISPRELEPGVHLSVAHGVAYLKGNVPSYERKKALSAKVARLPDVARVVNLLRVMPGSLRADDQITKDVTGALTATFGPDRGEMKIRVINGVVEMEGTVPDLSTRIAAEAAAWSVSGVQHVHNRLQLTPAMKSNVADVSVELRECLKSALGARSAWVELEFARGGVVLRGLVLSGEDKLAAEDCLRCHPAVRTIVNELTVASEGPLGSLEQSA